jgi:hypothetical protein
VGGGGDAPACFARAFNPIERRPIVAEKKDTKPDPAIAKLTEVNEQLAAKLRDRDGELDELKAMVKEATSAAKSATSELEAVKKKLAAHKKQPKRARRMPDEPDPEFGDFLLVGTANIQQEGEARPKLVKASPEFPVRVRLPKTVMRTKRDDEGKRVADGRGKPVLEQAPQPVFPDAPHLYPIDEAPPVPEATHIPPQPQRPA